MRKVVSLLVAMVLCAMLICPVFAEEFVPSINGKDIEIVLVDDGKGGKAIAQILDENGNVIDFAYEECLVITPISNARTSDEIPDDAEVLLFSVYDQLMDGSMSLPYEKHNANLDKDTMVIHDLFDVSWLCGADSGFVNHPDHPEEVAKPKVTVKIIFNLGVGPNTDVYCMSYKNGEWNPIVSLTNNGDGTVTCVFEDFCPVEFSVGQKANTPPAPTYDPSTPWLWIALMAVSLVALGGVILFSRRKAA